MHITVTSSLAPRRLVYIRSMTVTLFLLSYLRKLFRRHVVGQALI